MTITWNELSISTGRYLSHTFLQDVAIVGIRQPSKTPHLERKGEKERESFTEILCR
jgi:hypothetical protein